MKIPQVINFVDLQDAEAYGPSTSEYKALKALKVDGSWKDYCNQMLTVGVSVRFEPGADEFFVRPNTFPKKLKEGDETLLLKDDEDDEEIEVETDDIDVEDSDLDNIMDEPVEDAEIEAPIEDTDAEEEDIYTDLNTDKMQVVSLEDVLKILQQVQSDTSLSVPAPQPTASGAAKTPPVQSGPLEGGPNALKNSYFQSEGNEILDSEFEENSPAAQSVEDKIDSEESYVVKIDALPEAEFQALTKQFNTQLEILGITADQWASGLKDMKSTDNTALVHEPSMMEPQFDTEAPVEISEPESEYGQADNDYEYDDFEKEEGDEEEEILMDDEKSVLEEDDLTISDHWDDEDEEMPNVNVADEDMIAPIEDKEIAPVTVNKTVNVGGTPVQIILTGVMITQAELGYISESVKKAGNKLKTIVGKGNEINIVLESNKKQYTINYVDLPRNKTKTPFSVKKIKFTSLEEALSRINRKHENKEKNIFKNIISEDIANRNTSTIKEADIFKGFEEENVNYVSGWNINSVGELNLKNGLNETYSNILEHGKEPNTLVVNEKNQYFLIKGNLKESSKKGVVRELVDVRGKKSFGVAKVVGIFENTHKGLGDIMFQVKRTSLPLLVWK